MGEDKKNPMNPYLYLAGVVSFGPSQCGTKGYPGVYTVMKSFTLTKLICFVTIEIIYSTQIQFIHRELISTLTGF